MVLRTTCQHTFFDHITDQLAHHGPRASNHFRQVFLTQLENDESTAPVFDPKARAKVLKDHLESFTERKPDESGVTFEQRRPQQ